MTEDPFQHVDEVFEFRHSLNEETDRGCALMAAAYLADQLEVLLRRTFVDDRDVIDELLRPLGPLGSFSGRIEICYALGLLPNQTRRDLHLIRKIRNDFGHVAKILTFAEPAISARCGELRHSVHEPEARPRAKFTNAVLGVCGAVRNAVKAARQSEVPSDYDMHEVKRGVLEIVEAVTAEMTQKLPLSQDPTSDKSDG
jgi:DNA-binding MltR family transcriptional regulator